MLPDSKILSRLLQGIYDAAADQSKWQFALEQLAENTRAQAACLLMKDQRREPYSVSTMWGYDPEAVRLYNEHYAPLDVWAKEAAKITAQQWVCTSESLCSPRDLIHSEYYNDFLTKEGYPHAAFSRFQGNGHSTIVLALYRTTQSGEFQDGELTLLQFITPHIQRAFNLHLTASELRERSAGLAAALDMLSTGVALLAVDGKILHLNRMAATIVSQKNGLVATAEGLKGEAPGETTQLDALIRKAIATSMGSGLSAGGSLLISRRGRPPIQVLVSPVGAHRLGITGSVGAIVFIADTGKRTNLGDGLLRMRFGLTPAESRVALLLSEGYSPREIANSIGVAQSTVRSQLKSIFSKMGIRRQGQLIRLLFDSAVPVLAKE